MKAPARIKVASHVYAVVTGPVGATAARHAETRGSTIADDLTIVLAGDLPRSRQRETLLHEVLHACWDESALRSHEDACKLEELVVTALSQTLVDVLRRNPKLVAFLTE